MQETICSCCEEVTISTTSYENVCAGLPWRKTCNAATLRKLSSVTDFINGCTCTNACMITIFLGLNQPAAFFKLQSKFIAVQRSCNPATVTIEHFATTVNGWKLLTTIVKSSVLHAKGFVGASVTVNNCNYWNVCRFSSLKIIFNSE